MADDSQLVVFTLDDRRYGLPLPSVERIIPAVELVPLPKAPDIVLGVISLQGRIVPVVDIRTRFGLAAREMAASDHIVVAHSARRIVALLVDRVEGTLDYAPGELIEATAILPGMRYVAGVIALKDGMVLIHDLDALLSLDEEAALAAALAAPAGASP